MHFKFASEQQHSNDCGDIYQIQQYKHQLEINQEIKSDKNKECFQEGEARKGKLSFELSAPQAPAQEVSSKQTFKASLPGHANKTELQ